MSDVQRVQLAPTGHDYLFTHAVLWGAGAIASTVTPATRLSWTEGLAPTPELQGIDLGTLADAVRERAVAATDPASWVQSDLPHERGRALFSPRVKLFPPTAWDAWQQARNTHLDQLVKSGSTLDLRFVAALGEPSSWHEFKGKPRQDDSANRLELQPRNTGSEFVGTRLRSLAAAVAARSADEVAAGLTGRHLVDEAGNDKPDSRSAANLRPPSPTDNALAWVAMWGLSVLPVVHLITRPSRTATHVPWDKHDGLGDEVRAGHVIAPVWRGGWSIARLRTVLRSRALIEAGKTAWTTDPVDAGRAQRWLQEKGVTGLMVMPMHTFGSTSSPERRVMAGHPLRLGSAAI